jgi:hypothetical protein
VLLGL